MGKSNRPTSGSSEPDPYLGAVINDHIHIDRKLGEGGMSTVYATLPLSGYPARAVKILKTDLMLRSEDAVRRFGREAEIMVRLDHPNVVPVIEWGVASLRPFKGEPYIVMRLVKGKTVEDLIEEKRIANGALRFGLEYTVWLITEVGSPLIAAHGFKDAAGNPQPIIHRDIKPSNVFIEHFAGKSQVLLADFGVACFQDRTVMKATLSEMNLVVGSLNYMAPEQATNEPLDAKADVYALGVMTYQMLCGRLPIEDAVGDNTQSYLLRVISEAPLPLGSVMPNVTPLLNDLVMAALEKLPVNRPTVDEFCKGLAHATGAQMNRSMRPTGPPANDAERILIEGEAFPKDALLPSPAPVDILGSEPPPLVTRKADVEDPLDYAKTQTRLPKTDPPRLKKRMSRVTEIAFGVVFVAVGVLCGFVLLKGMDTIDAVMSNQQVHSPRIGPAPSAADAGLVPFVDSDAGVAVAHQPFTPPAPLTPAVAAARAACQQALPMRNRPRGWEAQCQTYVAARCPAPDGESAIDCELIKTMLQRMRRSEVRRQPTMAPDDPEPQDETQEPSP